MIQETIQGYYDFLTTGKFADLELLGVFAYGSMNYGYYKEGVSDIDAYAIIFPKYEALYENNKMNKEYQINDKSKLMIVDIRIFMEDIIAQKLNALQLLCTDYKVINPKYERFFNETFNCDKCAAINPKAFVLRLVAQGIKTIEKKNLTNKDLHNAMRVFNSALDYLYGLSLKNVLCSKNINVHNMLYDIKYSNEELNKEEVDRVRTQLEELKERILKEDISFDFVNEDTIKFLREEVDKKIKEVVIHYLNKSAVAAPDFIKTLSMMEKKGLTAIINKIGEEGTISINKLVEETNISRAVYNSLLNKLEKANAAEITNSGVKGTHISFTLAGISN